MSNNTTKKRERGPFIKLLEAQAITSGVHTINVSKRAKIISETGVQFNITPKGEIDYDERTFYTFASFLLEAFRTRVKNYATSILLDNKELQSYQGTLSKQVCIQFILYTCFFPF